MSLQRYTKSLTNFQRAALVEKSRQKPPERMASLTKVGLLSIILETLKLFLFLMFYVLIILQGLKDSNYNADPVLQDSGVSIITNFTQVEGRILPTPKVTFLAFLAVSFPFCLWMF